ncbi:MAG TPA: thioredoxin domain-containing protein [Pyrinomonadaceae bacterium]|nr:thioredoxin domain-containing protein [Pyrinomonadaceae bacterium]
MRKEVKILGAIALVIVIAAIIGASYYRSSVQNERITTNSNSNKSSVNAENLIRPDSATLGAADAPVTMVEFYDPECESCASFHPVVKKIMKDYDGKIRLVARYMPLHPNSLSAATFIEAAGEQGKYWQAQEMLFQKQSEWGTKHGLPTEPPADINTLFKKYATELGLEMNKMDAAFAENRYQTKIQRDLQDGQALGVRQTPTFFVNGRRLARFSEADLRALIEEELKK